MYQKFNYFCWSLFSTCSLLNSEIRTVHTDHSHPTFNNLLYISPWRLWLWTPGGCTGACCTLPSDQPQSTGTSLSALQASTGDTFPVWDKRQTNHYFSWLLEINSRNNKLCVFMSENLSSLTRPISLSLVNMTTIVELFSQSILQKSSVVSAKGPCVAM